MTRLIILACVAFVVVGLGQLVVGAVMEPMVQAYGIQYGDGGQLVMHQFLGGMLGVMLAPWLIGKIGKKKLLLSALAIMTLAEAVYVSQPSWAVMLTAAPFAGLGFGTTEAVVASFIISAAGRNANVAMSRVEVSFGVGALLMPLVGAAFINAGYWVTAFGVVSVLSAMTLLLWIIWWPSILDRPVSQGEAESDAQKRNRMSRSRMAMVWLGCGCFFAVYVGFEISFVNYFPSLLVQNNGMADSAASLSLGVYWGAMVLGRLVSGHVADRWGSGTYMMFTCISSAVIFVIMGGVDSANGLFVLTFFAGLVMSGMYSIALVFVNRAVPGLSEKTTSLMMVFGGIGGALMPKLTGWFLDEHGADATRWLFAVIAAVMLAVIIWALLVAMPGRRKQRAQAQAQNSV
ncbi:MFS transporter [Paenibacillus kobensis]|uniref:MFS transporter n=1 Tax=Paenibacillus kobensis TaxID=59841 RepID=UPI000FDBD156|nr:MFS transporter [Paenibacillus kobensis]